MPVCLQFSYTGNQGAGSAGNGRTVVTDGVGNWDKSFPVYPQAAVLQAGVTDFSACSAVALTAAEYDSLAGGAGVHVPVDGGVASGFFSFGLTMVVGCYLVAHKIGLVLDFVRRS